MLAAVLIACSCGGPVDFARSMASADAVFTATIVAKWIVVYNEDANVLATARAGRVLKGNPPATVRIRTGIGGGDCGIHLDRGATYIIFGYRDDGGYATGACTRTSRLGSAHAAPNTWRQRVLNLWSVAVVLFAWPSFLVRWTLISAAIAACAAVIVVRKKVLVALSAWLLSLASLLELPIVLWLTMGGIIAVLVYVAIRKRLFAARAFRIAAPIVLAALLIVAESRMEVFSLLGLMLDATQAIAIAFIVLAIFWYASMASCPYVAVPATLVLALLAARTHGPWQLLFDALR